MLVKHSIWHERGAGRSSGEHPFGAIEGRWGRLDGYYWFDYLDRDPPIRSVGAPVYSFPGGRTELGSSVGRGKGPHCRAGDRSGLSDARKFALIKEDKGAGIRGRPGGACVRVRGRAPRDANARPEILCQAPLLRSCLGLGSISVSSPNAAGRRRRWRPSPWPRRSRRPSHRGPP
jgi:hypothetical protein